MKRCPKCGYVDPDCWRPAAFHPEISYAHIDGLEMFEPEVYEAIVDKAPGERVLVGEYVYWRSSRSPTVRRSWVDDHRIVGKRGSSQERVNQDTRSINEVWTKKLPKSR